MRSRSTTISLTCESASGGWRCLVTLADPGSETRHEVTVTAADLRRLAPDQDEPTYLVRRSFAFLLEREPKESILRSFDLAVIGRYFPEYEVEIRPRS